MQSMSQSMEMARWMPWDWDTFLIIISLFIKMKKEKKEDEEGNRCFWLVICDGRCSLSIIIRNWLMLAIIRSTNYFGWLHVRHIKNVSKTIKWLCLWNGTHHPSTHEFNYYEINENCFFFFFFSLFSLCIHSCHRALYVCWVEFNLV